MRILVFIPYLLLFNVLFLVGCSSSTPDSKPSAHKHSHGKITTLSAASSKDFKSCEHNVPQEVCTRCNPHLEAKFKEAKDWCGEHGVPESQCYKCHPDLTFEPLPELKEGADLVEISKEGEDISTLDSHVVQGKVTLFDFYAVWCAPCRKIDAHVYNLLNTRDDIALRKLNMVNWETPLSKHYLKDVRGLPYIKVYDKKGVFVKDVAGFDLKELDKVIAEASKR